MKKTMLKNIFLTGLAAFSTFTIPIASLASANPTTRNASGDEATMIKNIIDNKELVTLPSGLQYLDVKVGTGETAQKGEMVTVQYTGWLTDGTKFDSSRDRAQPFTFKLGAGQVIQGWDAGVLGMKVGGVRDLVIPANLGYGARGAGNVIPPNATLVFEVELLKTGK